MKVEFQNAEGQTLAGRLELPPGPTRAVALFAHCFTCSKDVAAASRISRALAQKGYAVLRFDFTGLGGSDGDFANTNFSSNVEDLIAASSWLEQNHEAPALLVGHSLGGAAVLTAAPQLPSVQAVATIGAPSEPSHVEHLFCEARPEIELRGEAEVQLAGRNFRIKKQFLDDLSEQRLGQILPKLDKAVLILHSPQDETVSVDHARKLYVALRHPKSFISLDGADHLLTRRDDGLYVAELIASWAERYLPPLEQPKAASALADGEVLVEEDDPAAFRQRITVGPHQLIGDEPPKVGGQDQGPDPYEYLLSALGTCTAMTVRMYARRKQWPLEHVSVRLRHHREYREDCDSCDDPKARIDVIDRHLKLVGDQLDDEQRARLLEIADRCPVHRTLENEKQIRTTLV
ncbi:MAG: bifunctional alpha/beta hydrolase/OsmC family protein [Planctomycetota bacterium]